MMHKVHSMLVLNTKHSKQKSCNPLVKNKTKQKHTKLMAICFVICTFFYNQCSVGQLSLLQRHFLEENGR